MRAHTHTHTPNHHITHLLYREPGGTRLLRFEADLERVPASRVLDKHKSAASNAEGCLGIGWERPGAATAAFGADALAARYTLAAVLVDRALEATALCPVIAAAFGADAVASQAIGKGAVARRAKAETECALTLGVAREVSRTLRFVG